MSYSVISFRSYLKPDSLAKDAQDPSGKSPLLSKSDRDAWTMLSESTSKKRLSSERVSLLPYPSVPSA